MPNDAKLGMVTGVALVILVAVVFFRRDVAAGSPGGPKAVTPAPRTSGVHGPARVHARPAAEKSGRVWPTLAAPLRACVLSRLRYFPNNPSGSNCGKSV